LFGRDPLAEALMPWIDADTARLWQDADGSLNSLGNGPYDDVGMRTRYVDDYNAHAVAAGGRRVVVLGSGMDGRPYRAG
jgi:O-methyltransferase involved in polyketide biosynthesis